MGLDLTRVTVALDVTPGGAVTFDTNHLASDDVRVCPTRLSNPSVAVNGYRVFSSEFAQVNLGADACENSPRFPRSDRKFRKLRHPSVVPGRD